MFHHHRLLSPSLQPSSDRRYKPAPGFSRIVRSLPKHLSICLAEITKPNKRLLLCTSDSLSFLVVDVRVPPVACRSTPAGGNHSSTTPALMGVHLCVDDFYVFCGGFGIFLRMVLWKIRKRRYANSWYISPPFDQWNQRKSINFPSILFPHLRLRMCLSRYNESLLILKMKVYLIKKLQIFVIKTRREKNYSRIMRTQLEIPILGR